MKNRKPLSLRIPEPEARPGDRPDFSGMQVPEAGIVRRPGGERLKTALGRDLKGRLSPVLYLAGIGLAFIAPWLGLVPYVATAVMWLVPDRRIERYLRDHHDDETEDTED